MNITNKQQLANLMHHMDAANATAIALPQHNNARNSTGDKHRYSDTWYDELWSLRESDPDNTICINGNGVYLYGYKFAIDGHPVCYVSMEYDTVEPLGCALVYDDGINSPADLVYAWLGDTTLSEHTGADIIDLARRAGIDTSDIDA
jgi:hypothetical protein